MNKQKKIFLSMPMAGKTQSQIICEITNFMQQHPKLFEGNDIVESWNEKPTDGIIYKYIYGLGKSIQKMASADIVMFLPGWDAARGCNIEYTIAMKYDIPMIVFGNDGNIIEKDSTK